MDMGCSSAVPAEGSRYAQALREGRQALRATVLIAASEILAAERLRQSALAYRQNALAAPQLYQLTFGPAAPGHTPGPEAVAAADEALGALAEIVRECMDAGVLRRGDPRFVAQVLTAAAHGAVSLELSHYFWSREGAEERYATLTSAAAQAFS